MSLDDARKFFVKNLDIFSDPNLHSEKYNFYMGLVALVDALTTIFDELRDIDGEHKKIKTQMSTIQRRLAKIGREGR